MGADRLRVLALAIIALALVIASTWFLDWFTVDINVTSSSNAYANQLRRVDHVGFGLREATEYYVDGTKGSIPISDLPPKFYPEKFSAVVLWGSAIFAVLLLLQAGLRTLFNQVQPLVTKAGYLVGGNVLVATVLLSFVFKPDFGDPELLSSVLSMSLEIERTWATHLLMLGTIIGLFALHQAVHLDSQTTEIADAAPIGLPQARVVIAPRADSQPIPMPAPAIPNNVRRTTTAAMPRIDSPLAHLVGKLKYAVASAELTRGGIDARREDRTSVLVMWRDVVGVVARRMPVAHESIAFADVISTAGSTLRLVPWTRLSGDPVEGDGEARVRAFVQLVVERCPEVRVDRATREFLENRSAPAQLPDVETLAVHDSKLA